MKLPRAIAASALIFLSLNSFAGNPSIEELETSCKKGDADACLGLGLAYEVGAGVKQSYSKANALYEKACNLGDAMGCFNLGVLICERVWRKTVLFKSERPLRKSL